MIQNLNTKKTFLTILKFLILRDGKMLNFKKFRFSNATLNYSMIMKFHMMRLDLNTKKLFSEISKGIRGLDFGKSKFSNITRFLNDSGLRKFHMKWPDWNTKKPFLVVSKFLILRSDKWE